MNEEEYKVTIPVHVFAGSAHEAAIRALEIIRTEVMEPVVTVEHTGKHARNFLKVDTATWEVTDEYYVHNNGLVSYRR